MGRTSALSTAVVTAASIVAALIVASAVVSTPANAATCTADDIPSAVDATGAQLRTYTMQTQPQLQPRLKALSVKNGWAEEGYEEAAYNHLRDAKLEQLDKTSNELLARIDQLGEVKPGEAPDCTRLDGIKAAGVELLAVMKAKTAHVMGKIDAELGTAPASAASGSPLKPTILAEVPAGPSPPGPAPAPSATAPSAAPQVPKSAAAEKPAAVSKPAPSAETAPPVRKPVSPPGDTWQARTNQPTSQPPSQPVATPAPPARPAEVTVAVLPPDQQPRQTLPGGQPRPEEGLRAIPPDEDNGEDGYTIDEIREASRGVFGNLSTGLASVIEHAFRSSGRPTGYVLGTEGGGAFFGGLRYGSGTLYLRRGGTEKVYWHGPSLGFDFGASGTRTIFLVYKIREPLDLYRTFTGLDGSAFAVGGVGITLLGGGNMVLAPIRSGLGLRLGASIGYLRFTPRPTWNPL